MKLSYLTASICITLLLWCATPLVHAQLFMKPIEQMELSVSPQFPTPNSTVRVSISSFGVDTKDATIDWFINGTADTTLKNKRTIDIQTGTGESTIAVEARVRTQALGTVTLGRTIAPGAVDIIAEPNTYTPDGYPGTALPTPGSSVRVVAVPHLYQNGKRIPSSEVVFTWAVNGTTLLGGSQLGTDSTTIFMPRYGRVDITVIAEARGGAQSALNSLTLESEKPKVVVYEDSSLYGLRMVTAPFVTQEDEITLRAIPYYLHTTASPETGVDYRWRVDGVELQPQNPTTLTLLRAAGPKRHVDVSFSSLTDTLFMGSGSFDVEFTSNDSSFIP